MRKNNATGNARRKAGFTIAEVLIALLISVILGALVANLGYSMTLTARQSSLDRQAESIYESASRNLKSLTIAGDLDVLRADELRVYNVFARTTTQDGPGLSTDARSVREYREKDTEGKVTEYGKALEALTIKSSSSTLGVQAEDDDDGEENKDTQEEEDETTGDSSVVGAADAADWQREAEVIAKGLGSDTGEGAGPFASDYRIYCVSSAGVSSQNKELREQSVAVRDALLETGVVSGDVLDDEWCVFYAVDNKYDYASIIEAWYTTPEYSSSLNKLDTGYSFSMMQDVGIIESEDNTRDTETKRADLRGAIDEKGYSNRKDRSKASGYIGWYGLGSGALSALPEAKLGEASEPQCWIVATNAEKLIAHLYCYIPENGVDYYSTSGSTDFEYRLNMTGALSNATAPREPVEGAVENTGLVGTERGREKDKANGEVVSGTDGKTRGYYYNIGNITLDSFDSGESFSRFADSYGFIPGEDVTLQLEVTCSPTGNDSDKYVAEGLPNATVQVNSLFASVTKPQASEGGTGGDEQTNDSYVEVRYGRHLQNLDTTVSKLGLSNTLHVVQTQNIYFNGEDGAGTYPEDASWDDDVEQWSKTYSVSEQADSPAARLAFSPIVNDAVASYTGQVEGGAVIKGLEVYNREDFVSRNAEALAEAANVDLAVANALSTKEENAGLFARYNGSLIKGVTLEDPIINTGESCKNAGGFVGAAQSENLVFESCGLHMSAPQPEGTTASNVDWLTATTNAGGLVGLALRNVAFKSSYAATVVKATGSSSVEPEGEQERALAGGLAGSVGGSVNVEGSYADCYLQAANVGGLVGSYRTSDSGSFTLDAKSYSAGFVLTDDSVPVSVAGKFVADNVSLSDLKGSYSLFSFQDPINKKRPPTTYNNGVLAPTDDPNLSENAPSGNGYYLAPGFDREEDPFAKWPYDDLGLPHYGDWETDLKDIPLLQIYNVETLYAHLTLDGNGFADEDTATLHMYGLTSNQTAILKSQQVKNYNKDGEDFDIDRLYAGDNLDDTNQRFKKKFSQFKPGENILVWLTVTDSNNNLVYPRESGGDKREYAGYITNSLFAYSSNPSQQSLYVSTETTSENEFLRSAVAEDAKVGNSSGPASDSYNAYIAYGRHLQNLDAGEFDFQGFDNKPKPIPAAVCATQIKNIDFSAEAQILDEDNREYWSSVYSNKEFVPIFGSETEPPYYPYVQSYDGSGYTIQNVKGGTNSHYKRSKGLFATFSGNLLANITLVNAQFKDAQSYSGALAGWVERFKDDSEPEPLIVNNCRSYLDGSISSFPNESYISSGAYAGGLIGHAPRLERNGGDSIEITNSFASSIVSAKAPGKNASGARVGGLVGSMEYSEGWLTIKNSYADCYLIGSGNVGGLVGYATVNSVFDNCYSAGIVSQFNEAAGLTPVKVSAVKNCYSALYYDDDAGPTNNIYGLVRDAVGAVENETVNAAAASDAKLNKTFEGESTSSYYTFKNVNNVSAVWSDENGSLFNHLNGNLLGEYLTLDDGEGDDEVGGFVVGKGGTPYNLLGNRSTEELKTYPYPTLPGLPHYGDWLESSSEDLTGYEFTIHLQAPKREDGTIVTDNTGQIKKYELGKIVYNSENLSDFITVINPYYLASLYDESGKELPEFLTKDPFNFASEGKHEFKTIDEQEPKYPAMNNAAVQNLIVGTGAVSGDSGGAIETVDGDRSVLQGLSGLAKTVLPDAADWNEGHSFSRYFLIPATMSASDFFTKERGTSSTPEERLAQQTYRTETDTVFVAGFDSSDPASGGKSAATELREKQTGFGESISKNALNSYISEFASGGTEVNGNGVNITRSQTLRSGRQHITKYTGYANAYIEWFPKVKLMSLPADKTGEETTDFKTGAEPVKQYVERFSFNGDVYTDGNGAVVNSTALETAQKKNAELHYANFTSSSVGGSYFADPSMSSDSMVREQSSPESTADFLARYVGFSRTATANGNYVLKSKGESARPFLGFYFDSDDSFGQVYNNRGIVPQAVTMGSRFIDRDCTAYARYGYAVMLKMLLPVTHEGVQMYRYKDTESVTDTAEDGSMRTRAVRYYLRSTGTGTYVKVDPETFEDVGDALSLTEEQRNAVASLANSEQVVGHVYYNSATAKLNNVDDAESNPIIGYSYRVTGNHPSEAASVGSAIAPNANTVAKLWGLKGDGTLIDRYDLYTMYSDATEGSPVTSQEQVNTYISWSGTGDGRAYSVARNLQDYGNWLSQRRNPETGEASAYAVWGTENPKEWLGYEFTKTYVLP